MDSQSSTETLVMWVQCLPEAVASPGGPGSFSFLQFSSLCEERALLMRDVPKISGPTVTRALIS